MNSLKSKAFASFSLLKRSLSTFVNKLGRFPYKKYQKHALIIAGAFGAANLAFSLFSVYTIISFLFMIICFGCFFQVNWIEIRSKGLVSYFPPKIQRTLLHRSLFDVFCDLWFIPDITLYAKAFLLPFFTKIDPSEAAGQFKELSPSTRKAILTKGIVNIMPKFIKSIMLPLEEASEEDESDTSSYEGDKSLNIYDHQNNSKEDGRQDKSMTEKKEILNSLIAEKDQNMTHERNSHASIDDDNLVNHNFSLSTQLEVKKTLPSFEDINPMQSHLDYTGVHRGLQNFKHNPQFHKGLKQKTKKLQTRELLRLNKIPINEPLAPIRMNPNDLSTISGPKKKKKIQLSDAWDKLEVFTKMAREKLMRQKVMGKMLPTKFEFKGHLQTLHNMFKLMSMEGIMEKLEGKNLLTIFMVSSLSLLLQLSLSKKTRIWCFYTLKFILYLSGIILSTGSLVLLALKLKTQKIKPKEEEPKREILSDLTSGDEEDEA